MIQMAEDCHILVVEDDPRLRERLARYLSGEGFRVTAACDDHAGIPDRVIHVSGDHAQTPGFKM